MRYNRILILALIGACASMAAAQNTVYSNSPGGDSFSGPYGTSQGLSFVGSGGQNFVYRETKNGATVGINGNAPRNGDGSVWFDMNGTDVKSEIAMSTAFLPTGDAIGNLGNFDSLSAWSADLMTVSSNLSNQAVIMRLELFNGTTYGSLVFDTGWTPGHFSGTVNYGTWQNYDLLGNAGTTWLRATSSLNTLYGPGATNNGERTLADWQSALSGHGFIVTSANVGMGSFNGQFTGAMDNLTLGFGGNNQSYNFEPVPEPASMAVLGLGAAALLRRRRKSA
jgi:hypothetical protein